MTDQRDPNLQARNNVWLALTLPPFNFDGFYKWTCRSSFVIISQVRSAATLFSILSTSGSQQRDETTINMQNTRMTRSNATNNLEHLHMSQLKFWTWTAKDTIFRRFIRGTSSKMMPFSVEFTRKTMHKVAGLLTYSMKSSRRNWNIIRASCFI